MDRLTPDVRIRGMKRFLESIAGHGVSEGNDGISSGWISSAGWTSRSGSSRNTSRSS